MTVHMRVQGIPARQYDAWDLGMTTSDDFTAAEVQYEATLPAVRQALQMPDEGPAHIPVVTGFLGRGAKTGHSRHSGHHLVCFIIPEM